MIKDNRAEMRNRPKEVCRVCGSRNVHSTQYEKPTMGCIRYLRGHVSELEQLISEAVMEAVGENIR